MDGQKENSESISGRTIVREGNLRNRVKEFFWLSKERKTRGLTKVLEWSSRRWRRCIALAVGRSLGQLETREEARVIGLAPCNKHRR